ncbi:hypothetical protein T08_2237 [Trichinella sp. T8]|nr:hypothetical protein T08_2237 [Trichinella sp. T8]
MTELGPEMVVRGGENGEEVFTVRVPTPSYTHHSYHLIPQSLSQSIFYENAARNVALSSFL